MLGIAGCDSSNAIFIDDRDLNVEPGAGPGTQGGPVPGSRPTPGLLERSGHQGIGWEPFPEGH